MGKAIALKLTEKEERIVNQLNQQGITHSELLRDALWNYFNSPGQPINQLQKEKAKLGEPEPVNQLVHDYIKHLEDEVTHLREQNRKLQEQLGGEITRLHGQIYRFSMMKTDNELQRQKSVHRDVNSVSAHPSEINDFLKKDPKKV